MHHGRTLSTSSGFMPSSTVACFIADPTASELLALEEKKLLLLLALCMCAACANVLWPPKPDRHPCCHIEVIDWLPAGTMPPFLPLKAASRERAAARKHNVTAMRDTL